MKYLDFYKHFTSDWDSPVFSIRDIKNIFPNFNNVQLSQWREKGYIRKIRKSQYFIADNLRDLRLLSRDLKKSYISMEYALSKHGLIPEAVFQVTAITPLRSEKVATSLGNISYRQIKPSLFVGYTLLPSVEYPSRTYALATLEKALFDLVYFRHDLKDKNDFESLRLTIDNFDTKQFQGFSDLVKHLGRKKRLLSFLNYAKKELLK